MIKNNKILIILLIGMTVSINSPVFAQPASRMSHEQRRVESEKRTKEDAQLHEEMLQYLKTVDPAQYEIYKTQYEQQKKIDQIFADFQKKKINLNQAKSSLYPLIEAAAEKDLHSLDTRIIELNKKIEELKARKINPSADEIAIAQKRLKLLAEIKSNPKKLIDFRVDNLLGKIVPPQKDLLGGTYP